MLPKYWRLRMLWDGDQTLTYNDGARIAVRCLPWNRNTSGIPVYGTVITEDLGFGAEETIVDEGEVEGAVVDNTSNLYLGIQGTFEVTADLTSTDGTAYLYVEESDDNSTWPSDQDNFQIEQMHLLCALPINTDEADQDQAVNFAYGEQ